MEYQNAIEILELNPENLSPDILKKAYRKLSLQYHPDVVGNTDGTKFILINAAYEYLKKNLYLYNSEEFRETEDELNTRVIAIRRAFDKIKNQYQERHEKTFNSMVERLIKKLEGYTSHRNLQKNINPDFQQIINSGVNNILAWFNSEISKIISEYDDWINGYLRSTYTKLLEEEFEFWYKSKLFYKHLTIALLIAVVMFFSLYFYSISKYTSTLAILPLVLGVFIYRSNVKKKYSFKENIKGLDISKFRMLPAQLFIQNDDSLSMVKSAMGFGSMGALVGSIGGPVGAVVGGAIGGFIGALFGEPLDELKEKTYGRMIIKLEEVEDLILKNLEIQIPKIEEELIKTIKDNFNRNKDRAVKLLLKSN